MHAFFFGRESGIVLYYYDSPLFHLIFYKSYMAEDIFRQELVATQSTCA